MGVPLKLVKRRGVRGGLSNNRDRSRFWPCLVFVVVTINTKISFQSVYGCMLRSINFCNVAIYYFRVVSIRKKTKKYHTLSAWCCCRSISFFFDSVVRLVFTRQDEFHLFTVLNRKEGSGRFLFCPARESNQPFNLGGEIRL